LVTGGKKELSFDTLGEVSKSTLLVHCGYVYRIRGNYEKIVIINRRKTEYSNR